MSKRLPIVTLPNEKLREPSSIITDEHFGTAFFEELCDDMIETMYDDDGIGIAAPQVAQQIRVIAIGKDALVDQKDLPFPLDNDLILVNPEFHTYSWRTDTDEEGCLSVPGLTGEVERHTQVTVRARDRKGAELTFTATKYFARVLQHEVDHLNGVLFVDRARRVFKNEPPVTE